MTTVQGRHDVDGEEEPEPVEGLLLPSDPGFAELDPLSRGEAGGVSRRTVVRWGAVGATGVAWASANATLGPLLSQRGLMSPDGVFAAAATAITDLVYLEN